MEISVYTFLCHPCILMYLHLCFAQLFVHYFTEKTQIKSKYTPSRLPGVVTMIFWTCAAMRGKQRCVDKTSGCLRYVNMYMDGRCPSDTHETAYVDQMKEYCPATCGHCGKWKNGLLKITNNHNDNDKEKNSERHFDSDNNNAIISISIVISAVMQRR